MNKNKIQTIHLTEITNILGDLTNGMRDFTGVINWEDSPVVVKCRIGEISCFRQRDKLIEKNYLLKCVCRMFLTPVFLALNS